MIGAMSVVFPPSFFEIDTFARLESAVFEDFNQL